MSRKKPTRKSAPLRKQHLNLLQRQHKRKQRQLRHHRSHKPLRSARKNRDSISRPIGHIRFCANSTEPAAFGFDAKRSRKPPQANQYPSLCCVFLHRFRRLYGFPPNRIATSNTDTGNPGTCKGNYIHNGRISFLDYSLPLS